jgi:hypothetical protein
LLDAVAGGLRILPEVNPSRLPRMADFALFGEAVSRALGNPPGTFLAAYGENRRDANESAVEDSPLAGAVRSLSLRGPWTGTAAELLDELARIVGAKMAESRHWPKGARGMSGAIRRLAPALRMIGVHVDFHDRTNTARLITIRLADGVEDGPSRPSPSSPAHESRGEGGDGRNGRSSPTVTEPSPIPWLETRASDGSDDGDGLLPLHSGDPGWEVFEL